MNTMAWIAATFWIGVLGTLYAYAIFPALAVLLARGRRAESDDPADRTPPAAVVTIVVPAHNEERSIEQKLCNVLGSDYPRELLDIIVVSDASTDRTDEIARRFEGEGVRLIVQERRLGKTAGLNRALAIARGGIVIFTDANAIYPRDTIRTLAKYFRYSDVGLVSGYTRYAMSAAGEISEATNLYTSLERIVKRAETVWGCCVGADGAIFAMRRALYRTLRDDDINDFAIPLSVIDQGYKCLFADGAFCSESPGKDLDSEFRRQSRITNRTLRALWRNAHLLNPVRFPAFSFFLFSHKVVRFLVPVFLTMSAVSLALLASRGGFYLAAAVGGLAAVALAAAAKGTLLNVFFTINLAVLHGWWKFLSGRTDVVWQHDRSTA